MVIEIPYNYLISQNIQTKPTRQSSFEAFSKGNYEEAYTEFRELLLTYTKDPLYKYYSGVCLVKMKKDLNEAVKLLQEAIKEGSTVKTLPSDGLFYLGQAQQMSGKYSEATESYNSYTERVGKRAAKEMGVPELLQECLQKKGLVSGSEIKPNDAVTANKSDTVKSVNKTSVKEPLQETLDRPVPVRENIQRNYEIILSEALEFQAKADSISGMVTEQKKSLEKLTGIEKSNMQVKISSNEKLAAFYQNKADQKYNEAQLAIKPGQDSTAHFKGLVRSDNKTVRDSAKKANDQSIKKVDNKLDTAKMISTSANATVEVFSFFEAASKSVADPKATIVIDPEVPQGLIYRIQIAVFRNPVTLSYFKGLSPIYGFKVEGTDKTIYYAGMFRKLADARKAVSSVKSKGFKDAFVIALLDNKRVSADRAAALEKEWGGRAFYAIEKIVPETKADTITPTLTFRVEVVRSPNPLTEDAVEGMRKIAGNRGLDIQLLEDGKIEYVIGKFITFETAAEYADLLKRNGYREAQVVAWLGKKQIPVETARQLFEKLR
jgi:tetratricopeptide (TPR) repeat protein